MQITAKEVLEHALTLIDEMQDDLTFNVDDIMFKKTPKILNVLCNELINISKDIFVSPEITNGKTFIKKIENLEQVLEIDYNTAITVLVYGLAAQLLLVDDPSISNYFNQKYEEGKYKIKSNFLSEEESVIDLYNMNGI